MRKRRSPDDVRGTPQFKSFYTRLRKDCEPRKVIEKCLDSLRKDMLVGDKIGKNKWPRMYANKYDIRNLFRLDATKECRLTYTIIAEDQKKIVCVIEFFSSHAKYNRRFGYS